MIVYKYRGGDKDSFKMHLDSLVLDYFWASDARSLNDPCETRIDKESIKEDMQRLIRKKKPRNMKEVQDSYNTVCQALEDILNSDIGIFSLSKTHLDELLWAYYANSHKGFCIGYDLDIITKNNSIRQNHRYEVRYSNTIPKIEISDMKQLKNDLVDNSLIKKFAATKSKRWENEEEVRIITDNSGKQSYDYRAVKSIYFGLRMDEEEKHEIMNELKGRNIQYFQIESKENSYEFFATQMVDKYPTNSKYLYEISPISSYCVMVDNVLEEYKSLISYLHKAVEIARREPYCKQVYSADFKFSEKTQKRPDVFVNCEKSNDDFPNYYYTLDEIDILYEQIIDVNE